MSTPSATSAIDLPTTTYYEGTRWPVPRLRWMSLLRTETLEHVPEPAVFLAEAFAVLTGRPNSPHRPVRGSLALHPPRLLAYSFRPGAVALDRRVF